MLDIIFVAISAYLLGSIPFGLLLSHLFGLGDIRKIGSGNIGATNVMRTGNKKVAALTLLLDLLKGVLAVVLAYYIAPDVPYAPLVAAALAVIGHDFPLWLKFKGGKGVATSLGVIAAVSPLLGFTFAAIWITVFLITRTSSLSAILAAIFGTLVTFKVAGISAPLFWLVSGLSILLLVRHAKNIQRILEGKEGNFAKRSESTSES